MDWNVLTPYVVALVAVVIVYALYRRGRVTNAVDALTEFQKAAAVAQDLVAAAEQLYVTGELPPDARLDWVMAQLGELFPNLTETQLRAIVEASVYWLRRGVAALTVEANEK